MTSTLTVWLFGGLKSQHVRRTKKLLTPQDHDQRRADPRLPKIWRWLEACDNLMGLDGEMVGESLVGLSNKSLMRMVCWGYKLISFNWLSNNNTNRDFKSNSDEIRSVSFPFFCQEANCRIRSVLWGWSSTLSGEYGRIPACKGVKCWEVLPGKVKVHCGNRNPPPLNFQIYRTNFGHATFGIYWCEKL